MSRHYFHRADLNATEIYGYLDKLGITYEPVGVVDIICGFGGITICCEIRRKGLPHLARPGRQARFHARWTGGIRWLSDWDDCVALRDTFIKWHRAITAAALRP